MSLFDKLFKNSSQNNSKTIDKVETINSDETAKNKIECFNCNALVDKNAKFCGKCGKKISFNGENFEGRTEEKIEYNYPDIELIQNNEIKNAIKNIPTSEGLNVPIGLDKDNNWVYYDITKMPNLLIGGTVMSGKTNMINSILLSLITKYSNEDVKIIIADSKGLDYAVYDGEPHLLTQIIKDVRKLERVLKEEINEMQKRYSLLSSSKLKRIFDYNKLNDKAKVPYHIIFIDEYTTFASRHENECNSYIEQIAKSGWNVGIHMIIVANHPTVDVLTAISQLNFPTRLSFRVPSIKDSRMILEATGAEKISGIGNALINSPIVNEVKEINTKLIEDNDVTSIIKDLTKKNQTKYAIDFNEKSIYTSSKWDLYEEPLYNEIVEFVITQGKTSASLLQRKFRLGYNRAARAIDLLEERGIIGPQNGSKPREVLAKLEGRDNY